MFSQLAREKKKKKTEGGIVCVCVCPCAWRFVRWAMRAYLCQEMDTCVGLSWTCEPMCSTWVWIGAQSHTHTPCVSKSVPLMTVIKEPCCFKPFSTRTQLNHRFLYLLVEITPLHPNNESLFCFLWMNVTCMMGIVGREERASSCCRLVSQTNRETAQWDKRPLAPFDCLVVKPTAGAFNDKRWVNYFKEGPFRKLAQREREAQETVGVT